MHNGGHNAFAGIATEPIIEPSWAALVPEDQWRILRLGATALEGAGVPFLIHGAMAMATYTGRWRNTKDLDFVVHPRQRETAIEAIRRAGFDDYYAQEAYDRSWIFRGVREGVILDLIWELPNHRVPIDEEWFRRGVPITLGGYAYVVVPAEELVRVKLYVMQRERCDWVDVLNIMAGSVERIDWRWLVARMARDMPLLQAALAIFSWMSPARARALPEWLRQQFALPDVGGDDPQATELRRVRLFDSRPWFAPHQPVDQPLER